MAFKEVQDIQLDSPKFIQVDDIQLDEPGFNEVQNIKLDEPEGPGFVERVGEDIGKRIENVSAFAGRQEHPIAKAPAIGAIALGQVAGGVSDVISEGVVSGFKTVVPEEIQEGIKNAFINFTQTKVGKMGLSALEQGQEAFDKFEDKFPDAAMALGSMTNILGTGFGLKVGTKGAKLTAKEILDIGDDFSVIVGKSFPQKTEKLIKPITKRAIEKAIRPSVSKAKTATESKRFFNKANEAVNSIIENKNNLKLTNDAGELVQGLPTNLKQFSEAISSTKKDIFDQYDKVARLSGVRGAEVDLNDITSELDSIINNRGMTQDIIQYAQQQKDELLKLGKFSATEAQTRIQVLNNKLNSITDFNSAAKSSVDSLIVNKLRKSLNDVIEQTTGPQYSELKRKYGSLKEIERDVNRRAMVDARGNVKGLIDFTDIFTGSQVIEGIVRMSPSRVAAGLTGKAISTFHKTLNNPNKIVKNMFNNVESIIDKSTKIKGPLNPQSKLIREIIKKRGK